MGSTRSHSTVPYFVGTPDTSGPPGKTEIGPSENRAETATAASATTVSIAAPSANLASRQALVIHAAQRICGSAVRPAPSDRPKRLVSMSNSTTVDWAELWPASCNRWLGRERTTGSLQTPPDECVDGDVGKQNDQSQQELYGLREPGWVDDREQIVLDEPT